MFVDFGDVEKSGHSFHYFAHAPVHTLISFAIFGNHQLYRLRERFMPLREFFKSFINCHREGLFFAEVAMPRFSSGSFAPRIHSRMV